MTLKDMNIGEKAYVLSLENDILIRRRLLDMGLIEGTEIECVLKNPKGDPCAYLIRGATVALRCEDAKKVFISCGSDRKWA